MEFKELNIRNGLISVIWTDALEILSRSWASLRKCRGLSWRPLLLCETLGGQKKREFMSGILQKSMRGVSGKLPIIVC